MSESIGSAAKGLKPCKRYIATHDANGRSVYAESPEQVFHAVENVGGMARSYSVSSVPAVLENGADIKAYQAEEGATSFRRREIVLPQPGANLLVVDLEPGGVSMMVRAAFRAWYSYFAHHLGSIGQYQSISRSAAWARLTMNWTVAKKFVCILE